MSRQHSFPSLTGQNEVRDAVVGSEGKIENDMSTYGIPSFASLEQRPTAGIGSLAASFSVQSALVLVMLYLAITAPQFINTQISHIDLVAPTPELVTKPPEVVKTVRPQPRPIKDLLPPVPAKIETPMIAVQRPQRIQRISVPELQVEQTAAPRFDSKVLNALPGPHVTPKVVASTNFGGSSAAVTLPNTAPSKVQTGGFGDPNGVPVNPNAKGKSNIAAAGSFDLPGGPGYGNGTGGARGQRGTVSSAGFGNGTAVQGGGGRGGNAGQGRVQSTGAGFNQAPAAAPTQRASTSSVPANQPVAIQSKPQPVYTREAREKRVEGEVLLNVVFAADGRVRVLSVIRGLGYGLDEAAQRAVQGLKFTPALRDGHPVDSTATLHVIFQLS